MRARGKHVACDDGGDKGRLHGASYRGWGEDDKERVDRWQKLVLAGAGARRL